VVISETLPSDNARKRLVFTLSLLLATWIPMVFFIAVGMSGTSTAPVQNTKAVLLLIGAIHVPATCLLYIDRDFLRLIPANRSRYLYLPIALSIGAGVLFAFGGLASQMCVYLMFWAWQAYHYGRQNIGVYSFAAMAQGWRPRQAEKRVLQMATACGVCGTFKILGMDVAPGYLHGMFDALYRAGYWAFIGVLLFSIQVFLKNRKDFSPTKALFFFTFVLFFFPIFLWSNVDGAFFSYAIGHGAQYMVFMTVLSINIGKNGGRRDVSRSMMAVGVFVMLVSIVGYYATNLKGSDWAGGSPTWGRLLDFMVGIGVGTTIAHFVIDAGAWRLSQSSTKDFVARRFAFLFGDRLPGVSRHHRGLEGVGDRTARARNPGM
jgi:hypothetical protein